jgi:hypothetical protein
MGNIKNILLLILSSSKLVAILFRMFWARKKKSQPSIFFKMRPAVGKIWNYFYYKYLSCQILNWFFCGPNSPIKTEYDTLEFSYILNFKKKLWMSDVTIFLIFLKKIYPKCTFSFTVYILRLLGCKKSPKAGNYFVKIWDHQQLLISYFLRMLLLSILSIIIFGLSVYVLYSNELINNFQSIKCVLRWFKNEFDIAQKF